MIQANCRVKGCELPITEAEHIDDGVRILQQHYRLLHPTKAFHVKEQATRLEAYNQNLDEIMTAYYGDRWVDAMSIPEVVHYCNRYILIDDEKFERFCKGTVEEAKKFIADNPLNAAQQADAAQQDQQAVQEVDEFVDAAFLPPDGAPIWNPAPAAPRAYRRLRGR